MRLFRRGSTVRAIAATAAMSATVLPSGVAAVKTKVIFSYPVRVGGPLAPLLIAFLLFQQRFVQSFIRTGIR